MCHSCVIHCVINVSWVQFLPVLLIMPTWQFWQYQTWNFKWWHIIMQNRHLWYLLVHRNLNTMWIFHRLHFQMHYHHRKGVFYLNFVEAYYQWFNWKYVSIMSSNNFSTVQARHHWLNQGESLRTQICFNRSRWHCTTLMKIHRFSFAWKLVAT